LFLKRFRNSTKKDLSFLDSNINIKFSYVCPISKEEFSKYLATKIVQAAKQKTYWRNLINLSDPIIKKYDMKLDQLYLSIKAAIFEFRDLIIKDLKDQLEKENINFSKLYHPYIFNSVYNSDLVLSFALKSSFK
jgi:hypothetical protein